MIKTASEKSKGATFCFFRKLAVWEARVPVDNVGGGVGQFAAGSDQ